MSNVRDLFNRVWTNRPLRQKLLFTGGIFFIFRLLAHVPLPAVDVAQLQSIFAGNQFLSLLNIFSGGTLANFSIVAVGINPYITASIIIQLVSLVFPKLKEMQKEGEAGQQKVNQYTRLLAVPLAVVQSISVLALLKSQNLLASQDPIEMVGLIITLVAGAMVVMWLGELITEFGIGNGISMILLIGILSQLPSSASQIGAVLTGDQLLPILAMMAMFVGMIALVVFINEAVRKIPIQYAKRERGSRVYGTYSTHLPIRVNVSGVLPIIFALTIMLIPAFLGRVLVTLPNETMQNIGQKLLALFAQTSPIYAITYFMVVFGFSFLSAMIFFNADDISKELKKSGAFIPGIRPGALTRKFLEFVVNRITLIGAVFLGSVAVLPTILQNVTGIQTLAIGGTSILIVVSVILETAKQIDGLLVEQNYDQYR